MGAALALSPVFGLVSGGWAGESLGGIWGVFYRLILTRPAFADSQRYFAP